MQTKQARDITRVFDDGAPIDEALEQAAHLALLRHKQAGLPVAIWRDGKVAWVPAEELDPTLAVSGTAALECRGECRGRAGIV